MFYEQSPLDNQVLRGDIAQRINDITVPNGELNAADLVVLQRIILGEIQN